ncbi:MAG: SET domain-containing protein-lysine N-methyltransferase [Nitrososphaeraceae archaeon]
MSGKKSKVSEFQVSKNESLSNNHVQNLDANINGLRPSPVIPPDNNNNNQDNVPSRSRTVQKDIGSHSGDALLSNSAHTDINKNNNVDIKLQEEDVVQDNISLNRGDNSLLINNNNNNITDSIDTRNIDNTINNDMDTKITNVPNSSRKRGLNVSNNINNISNNRTTSTNRSRSASKTRSNNNNNNDASNNTKQYEVKQIVDHRINHITDKLEYLIRWKDYGSNENTWEPAENLTHCKGLINDYESKLINIKKLKLNDHKSINNTTHINNGTNGEMNIKQFEINNNGRNNEIKVNNDGVINTDKFIVHNQNNNINMDESKFKSPEEYFQSRNKKLVSVYGDGNCLYRAFSLLHGGDERYYTEYRLNTKNKIISYKSLKDTEYPPKFRVNLPCSKSNWPKAIDTIIEDTGPDRSPGGIVQAEALALYYDVNIIYNICDYNIADGGKSIIMSNYTIGPSASNQPIDIELLLHKNHFYLVVPIEKYEHYYKATIKETRRMQSNTNGPNAGKGNDNNNNNNGNDGNNNHNSSNNNGNNNSNYNTKDNNTNNKFNNSSKKNGQDNKDDNVSTSTNDSIAATVVRSTDWKKVERKSKRDNPTTKTNNTGKTNKQFHNPNLNRSQQGVLVQSFITEHQLTSMEQLVDGFTIHINKYPVKSGRNIFNEIVNKYDRRINQSETYRLTRPLLVHIIFGHIPGTRENQMLIELFDKYYPKPSYKMGITMKILEANLTNGQCVINVRYSDNCGINYQEAIQYMLQQYNSNKSPNTPTELIIIPHENKHVDLISCKLWPTPTYLKTDEELQLAFKEQGYLGKIEFAREGQYLLGVNAVCSRGDFALLLDLGLNPTGKILQKFKVNMIKSKRGPCYRCTSVDHMQYDCPFIEKPSLLCKHCGVVDKHKTSECKSKYKNQCRWCEKSGRKGFNTHNLSNCREIRGKETPVNMEGMHKQIIKIKEDYIKESQSNNSTSMIDETNKTNQWKDTARVAIMVHRTTDNNKNKSTTGKAEVTTGKPTREQPNPPNQVNKPKVHTQPQAQLKFVPVTNIGDRNVNELQETVKILAETVKQSMLQQQQYQQQSQQRFEELQNIIHKLLLSNYNNSNGNQLKVPPPSFELSQNSDFNRSSVISNLYNNTEPSPPPSQNTLEERKTKQQQFISHPMFIPIAESSKQKELTELMDSRLDRQAECLHTQLKYLSNLEDLQSNNNYDKKSETKSKQMIEQKNCPNLPGKKGIYAKRPIKGGEIICNYMGYLLPQDRPTQSLPCSTVVATEANGKLDNCFLVGIPNTIGPMMNHASATEANCNIQVRRAPTANSITIPSDWITIQAVEDIDVGEELTVDYGQDFWCGHEEGCSICFGKDSSNTNPILLCGGIVNEATCKTQIHLHCALLRSKPVGEYYCPCCINLMHESVNKSNN